MNSKYTFDNFNDKQVELRLYEIDDNVTGTVVGYDQYGLFLKEEGLTASKSTICFYPWSALIYIELTSQSKAA